MPVQALFSCRIGERYTLEPSVPPGKEIRNADFLTIQVSFLCGSAFGVKAGSFLFHKNSDGFPVEWKNFPADRAGRAGERASAPEVHDAAD